MYHEPQLDNSTKMPNMSYDHTEQMSFEFQWIPKRLLFHVKWKYWIIFFWITNANVLQQNTFHCPNWSLCSTKYLFYSYPIEQAKKIDTRKNNTMPSSNSPYYVLALANAHPLIIHFDEIQGIHFFMHIILFSSSFRMHKTCW